MISNTLSSLSTVFDRFETSLHSVADNIQCYCLNPLTDFSRRRKLDPCTLLKYLIQMGHKSIDCEICEYFPDIDSMPSASAIHQQRKKLHPSAFKRLLNLSAGFTLNPASFHGYRILAVDGTSVNIPFDPHDPDTLCMDSRHEQSYSQYHVNAIFDCLNQTFCDLSIDTPGKTNECRSLQKMIMDRYYPPESILVCDRNFEKWELFAQCQEMNQLFVIRVKDIHSNGILSSFSWAAEQENEEFDVMFQTTLTRKQTNEVKHQKEKYKHLPWSTEFKYMPPGGAEEYELQLRAVRFPISEDTYECVITNLDPEQFPADMLKELYGMRWREETGFKLVKYTANLLDFHSRLRPFIQQEIYTAFIRYNLTAACQEGVTIEQKEERKYDTKPNYTVLMTNVRQVVRGKMGIEELERRIKNFLVPIKPERRFKRPLKPKKAKPFNYRGT